MIQPTADHQAALAEALKACSRGWSVIPLHRPDQDGACSCKKASCNCAGKHPRTKHGLKDASSNPYQVEHWGVRWSGLGGCNYGVLTGQGSGIVVLDIDLRHGGFESLKALQVEHGELPTTPTAHTGGGGMHFYFLADSRALRSRADVRPGVDFKAEGGYIVSPGSLHASGASYFWSAGLSPDEVPLAALPGWLIDLLDSPSRAGGAPLPDQNGDVIPERRRNSTLASLAGAMRRRGMGDAAIQAALQAENTRKCNPPLSSDEVDSIAKSISRYAPGDTRGPRAASQSGSGGDGPGAESANEAEKRSPAPASADEIHQSDLGNSKRFADQHWEHLRYCHPWKTWLFWDTKRWARDRTGEVVRRAKATVRAIYLEVAGSDEKAYRDKLCKHALASESNPRIAAMLELAKSDTRIAVVPEEFDGPKTKWLLNVLNGTLDLRTLDLHPHDPSNLITKLAPVTYEPGATRELWERFLKRVLPDEEVRSYLQRFAGYSLTGDISEQVFALLFGTGANGKSTYLETLMALLGEYGHKADFETFLESKGAKDRKGGARVDLLALSGKRLIVATESSEGRCLDSATIKEFTGGDTITARGLYHAEQTSFRPEGKVMLAVNHLPEIKDGTESTWRRLHQVPFTETIPLRERDPKLPELLREPELLSGILNWALEGLQAWLQEEKAPRLKPPAAVLHASQEYRDDQDLLAPFLAAKCALDPDGHVTVKELRATYKQWCEANEQPVLGEKLFARVLGDHGVKRARGKDRQRTRGWVGIQLLDMFDRQVADTSDSCAGIHP